MSDDENLESLEIDKIEGSKEYLENSEKETHYISEDIFSSDTESISYSNNLDEGLLEEEIGTANGISGKLSKSYKKVGIKAHKAIDSHSLKIKKTATSTDSELLKILKSELHKLKEEDSFPNTLQRGRIVASYLNGEGATRKVGTSYGVSGRSVSTYLNAYRDGGIEALKAMENHPLKIKKVDLSKDAKLSAVLESELHNLEEKGSFPNTLQKGRIVASYLNGEGTLKEIGASYGISDKLVSNLSQNYRDGGIDALKAIESKPLKIKKIDVTKDASVFVTAQNSDKKRRASPIYLSSRGTNSKGPLKKRKIYNFGI